MGFGATVTPTGTFKMVTFTLPVKPSRGETVTVPTLLAPGTTARVCGTGGDREAGPLGWLSTAPTGTEDGSDERQDEPAVVGFHRSHLRSFAAEAIRLRLRRLIYSFWTTFYPGTAPVPSTV